MKTCRPILSLMIFSMVLLGALLAPNAARAAACVLTTPQITFPTYNPLDDYSAVTIGQIRLDCTPTTPAEQDTGVVAVVSLLPSGGTAVPREMVGPSGDVLQYDIYLDAGLTNVLGDGTSGTKTLNVCVGSTCGSGSDVGGASPLSVPVYGAVPPHQDVLPGGYTTTATLVVNF